MQPDRMSPLDAEKGSTSDQAEDVTSGEATKIRLFRPESVKHSTQRLDGSVILAVPIRVSVTSTIFCFLVAIVLYFATTATYARKERAEGWITWSSGAAIVRAEQRSAIRPFSIKQGDYVAEGEPLVWADTSYNSGIQNSGATRASGYMIRSPVSGNVALAEAYHGQIADADTVLFVIVPNGSELEARLLVPSRAMGFLKPGQEVLISIDAFPFQRFGTKRAQITSISQAPVLPGEIETPVQFNEASYIIAAKLNSSVVNAYDETVSVNNGMQLSAEIILERRNLIQWLLDPIYAANRSGT